jgi:hypothetical protein
MKKTFLLFSLLALFSCGSSTPDESDAKEAARAAILERLKNPLDARFHQNETIKDLGKGAYLYTETVNSTNSFGGSISQNVTLEVKWLGEDPSNVENWVVMNIDVTER